MRNTALAAMVAGWTIVPNLGNAGPIEAVLVQYNGNGSTEIRSQQLYTALSDELARSLALQGVVLVNLQELELANDPFTGLDTSAFREFAVRRLKGRDYAIFLSIAAAVTRNAVSRVVSLRADGAVVEISTGEVLTTYSVDAPEDVILPLSEADCNATCAEFELVDAKNGLGRELSFVLTQKMHFLQEDGVIPQGSDPVAIADRLKPTGDRPTSVEVVVGAGNVYTIDAARSLDIEVYFDPNSYQLTVLARNQLAALGEALQGEALSNAQYLIVGHTDASGAAEYNLALSERRAASVREYLIKSYAVVPDRLLSLGLGETQPKEPSKPNWGINRRVEVALLVDGPARKPDDTVLTVHSITFNLFARDDAVRVSRELEKELYTALALDLSNTTQRIYALKSDKTTEVIEQALLRALEDAGFALNAVRLTVAGQKITVDKL